MTDYDAYLDQADDDASAEVDRDDPNDPMLHIFDPTKFHSWTEPHPGLDASAGAHRDDPSCADASARASSRHAEGLVGNIAKLWLDSRMDASAEASPQPERITERSCPEMRRLRRAVEVYGVPLRHAQRAITGRLEPSEAMATVEAWRGREKRGSVLILSGEVGSGKSQAAARVVIDGPPRDYLERPWPDERHPRWLDVTDLHAIGLYDRSGAFDALLRCSVLAVDDVGTEYDDKSGVMQVLLDRLLNKRYGGAGWTVVTTNLSPQRFGERYGQRIMSRLHDDGCGFKRVTGQFREGKK